MDRVLHCWEMREGEVDGPCPHWPEGVRTWPELEAHDAVAAAACQRECWMGAHFGPDGICMLKAGHDGEHAFTNTDAIMITMAAATTDGP